MVGDDGCCSRGNSVQASAAPTNPWPTKFPSPCPLRFTSRKHPILKGVDAYTPETSVAHRPWQLATSKNHGRGHRGTPIFRSITPVHLLMASPPILFLYRPQSAIHIAIHLGRSKPGSPSLLCQIQLSGAPFAPLAPRGHDSRFKASYTSRCWVGAKAATGCRWQSYRMTPRTAIH